MEPLEQRIAEYLAKRKSQGNLRQLTPESPLVDFSSNDYLGLARSKELKQMIDHAVQQIDLPINGATGSRLITGNYAITESVEQRIADYHGAEAALLFNSGYTANVGLFSCVARAGDTILYDDLVHASIHDGMRLSKANSIPFRHNDVADFKQKLEQCSGAVFVALESVYSMDGDLAPITELLAVERPNTHFIMDEAHGTGVLGKRGEGLVSKLRLEDRFFARVHTYGKAHGLHGAAILTSKQTRAYLINFSRAFIYTTALPLHSVVSLDCGYTLLGKSEALIAQLKERIQFFQTCVRCTALKNQLLVSDSAIQGIVYQGNAATRNAAKAAEAAGYLVKPILSPTVAVGKERLRICLHAYNTEAEISGLVASLNS